MSFSTESARNGQWSNGLKAVVQFKWHFSAIKFHQKDIQVNITKLLIAAALSLTVSMSYGKSTAEMVCSYAPSQSAAVNRIITGTGGAGVGAMALLKATGLQFVAHSSGGYILTGAGGYVAGTLLNPLVVPTVFAATVIVGGTAIVVELSCAPRNHPEAVNSIKKVTAEFNQAVRSANAKAVDVRDGTVKNILELNEDAIVVRDRSLQELKRTNDQGIEIRDKASQYFAGLF